MQWAILTAVPAGILVIFNWVAYRQFEKTPARTRRTCLLSAAGLASMSAILAPIAWSKGGADFTLLKAVWIGQSLLALVWFVVFATIRLVKSSSD